MLERHLVIQRDGGDFAVLHVILTAEEHDVTRMDTVADHGIALGNQREIAGKVVLHGDVIRPVAGAVDRLAAGRAAQNRDAPPAGNGRQLRRQNRLLAGKRGDGQPQLLREGRDHGEPGNTLLGFVTADDLLGGAQQGGHFILRKIPLGTNLP